MHALPLAVADFGDWMKLIIAVGAILYYIINHLINESTQSRKRQQQQRKVAAAGQRPGEPAAQPQPAARDEIQDFLRRASQQRKEPTARKEPPRTPPAQRRPVTTRERPPAQRPAPRPQPTPAPARRYAEPVSEDTQIEVLETGRSVESLADQVNRKFSAEDRKFSTEEFSARAARMNDEIARADLERDLHRKKMFSHQVGKLTGDAAAPPAEERPAASAGGAQPEVVASSLAGLLQGGNLRYAVLLNEVLTRPEHRW